MPAMPVLYVIGCAAPPAAEIAGFVCFAQADGWDVCVIVTPDGAKFLDTGHLAALTGHPVRMHYKEPGQPDVLPPADAMVVAPATFNSLSKLAAGITDTLALGLVSEAVGLGRPRAHPPSGVRAQHRRAARLGDHGDPRPGPAAAAGYRGAGVSLGRTAGPAGRPACRRQVINGDDSGVA